MIEVNGLTKIYDGFRAVDNVDLVAKGGKVTILLGPNGAGKSTTIKSIANLLKFVVILMIVLRLNVVLDMFQKHRFCMICLLLMSILILLEMRIE